MSIVCSICVKAFQLDDNVYGTIRGHLCHYDCLTKRPERFKTCLQCKHPIGDNISVRKCCLNFDTTHNSQREVQDLKNMLKKEQFERALEVDKLKSALEDKIRHTVNSMMRVNEITTDLVIAQRKIEDLEQNGYRLEIANDTLQRSMTKLKEENNSEKMTLEGKLKTCQKENLSLSTRVAELEMMMNSAGNSVDPKTNEPKEKKVKYEKKKDKNDRAQRAPLRTMDSNKENTPPTKLARYNLRPRLCKSFTT